MTTVVRPWLAQHCTWKEQTVLFCALRGPDNGGSPQLKGWTRWIRSIVLENAAPHKTFMRSDVLTPIKDLAEERPLVFDMLPVHYFGHLMHALQVIAYRHPEPGTAARATVAYFAICEYLHLNPETPEQMTTRLRDEP